MKKISVMVDSLNRSQLSLSLITSFNELSDSRNDLDTIVFYRNPTIAPITPLFSCMSDAEAWGYDGCVIATDLKTAKSLIDVTGPTKKYFYIWDLEWLSKKDFFYDEMFDIYNSEELELIARSKHHSELISRCWKKPSMVMEDFEKQKLLDICGGAK